MLRFILQRTFIMVLTMLTLSLVLFSLVNLEPNLRKLALEQNNNRMSHEAVNSWLEKNGYRRPFAVRYGEWVSGVVTGDFSYSTRFRKPVNEVLPKRLGYTGILAFWVLVTMVPAALLIGILSGMREGSALDRSLSIFSVTTTATPEYVSGILFTVIFASWLGWLKGVSNVNDITIANFTLPVMTMSIYGMGYIARMTRASMSEVMTSQYIRTAHLKGLAFGTVVFKHALRNALIAPFTVILLQFPWLLTGVVIVEKIFNYKGFGWVLVEAAENNDINLLLACSLVSVVVVIGTQLISDVGYAYLNPRIRVES
ncbi:MAG TPA: ABC transporter permease [Deltaproteobacteria bacterium]|nr:ABC transporter permease [SAR324 cluster bacterium]HBL56779.1 peptide ABC transporter permease [Deltaproteobacteria bacterium]HHZ78449.1 ABC transporter permease [Candidatus Lambdaproteobacteria bacterium]HIA56486.1 ABC transporter permease [Candidatus Lambdaproteobacteria bacterium]HIB93919.1 ABC transporter permease [Candidatus Lambdaproteobacteria bacterium]